MVRMKCYLKNGSNNIGKGISSSKISAANLVKHIRGQHKIDADKLLKDIESLQPISASRGLLGKFVTIKPKTGGSGPKRRHYHKCC